MFEAKFLIFRLSQGQAVRGRPAPGVQILRLQGDPLQEGGQTHRCHHRR